MPSVEGSYQGAELEISFSAVSTSSDYGVPGSPRWHDIDSVSVDEITLLGVKIPYESLPESLQAKILELAFEEVDWENSEPDPEPREHDD